MDLYRRTLLIFISIVILGWLSQQIPYEHLGLGGVLLPGLIFGLPFGLLNFNGAGPKMKGVALNSIFATVSIATGFMLAFSLGPEGAGAEGMQFGLLLGAGCSLPLTVMIYAAYGLSWPSALAAIGAGSLLPALLGFENAQEATVKPELIAYFWLAVMGAIYSWGLKIK